MKLCTRCSKEKPTSEFYKNRRRKDGLQLYCKTCTDSMRNDPKYLSTDKYKQGRAAYRKIEAMREKIRACNALNRAVKKGRLPHISTQKCVGCTAPAHHYHHYLGHAPEHWFDVQPVCRKCHVVLEPAARQLDRLSEARNANPTVYE